MVVLLGQLPEANQWTGLIAAAPLLGLAIATIFAVVRIQRHALTDSRSDADEDRDRFQAERERYDERLTALERALADASERYDLRLEQALAAERERYDVRLAALEAALAAERERSDELAAQVNTLLDRLREGGISWKT